MHPGRWRFGCFPGLGPVPTERPVETVAVAAAAVEAGKRKSPGDRNGDCNFDIDNRVGDPNAIGDCGGSADDEDAPPTVTFSASSITGIV